MTDDDPARTDGGSATARRGFSRANLRNAAGRTLNKLVLVLVVLFLGGPIILTLVASFADTWQGVLPSGFVTLRHWYGALGIGESVGVQRGVGEGLAFSVMLATGGMLLNIVIGVPVAYALTRYDFYLRDWLNAFAILPLVPGIILGVAFLRTYPEQSGTALTLIIGYSLLKSPWLILTVQSTFQSMDLRQLEESARSLGASWPRAFLRVIVPNAQNGILAGAIITWTLAAAEFNFTYIVYTRGPRPFAIFLFNNINNATFLQAAAAVSIYFLIVAGAIVILQIAGNKGFSTAREEA
jgi:putative spermidine/putrescine transport system permease protein